MILQQETETTHVSKIPLLLYSQLDLLGLLVELQTSGVEHPADVLAPARDIASLRSSAIASLSKLLLWFSRASPATLFISSNIIN